MNRVNVTSGRRDQFGAVGHADPVVVNNQEEIVVAIDDNLGSLGRPTLGVLLNEPGLDGGAEIDLKATDTTILDELDETAEAARTKAARIEQLETRLEEIKAERDEWKDRYEEAECLADITADVQAAQLEHLSAQSTPS